MALRADTRELQAIARRRRLDAARNLHHEHVAIDRDALAAALRAEVRGDVRVQLAKQCEREHGLSFPPDTSTHAYATFGGMIANNSCGAHSVMTGRTSDSLESLDVLLYDGTRLTAAATSDAQLEAIVAAG